MSPTVWRIASDVPDWQAHDLTGEGAKRVGGRWNQPGIPMIYASDSRALACLETFVHLDTGALPLNRYLVRITIPEDEWQGRERLPEPRPIGWEAAPPGAVSIDWGSAWARKRKTLVAEVPSVIVPEEPNFLLNPRHPRAPELHAEKVRKWTYDPRMA